MHHIFSVIHAVICCCFYFNWWYVAVVRSRCKGRMYWWGRWIQICPSFNLFNEFWVHFRTVFIFDYDRLKSIFTANFMFHSVYLRKSIIYQWHNVVILTTSLLSIAFDIALRNKEVIEWLSSVLTNALCHFLFHLFLPISCSKLTNMTFVFFCHCLIHFIDVFREVIFHFFALILSFFAIFVNLLGSWRSWFCTSRGSLMLFENGITDRDVNCFPLLLFFSHF